jgi:hypothetical protein
MSTRPRCYPNHLPLSLPISPNQALKHFEHIVTEVPPVSSSFPANDLAGLFAGPTSIAYLFFLISQPSSTFADTLLDGKSPLDWAKQYLTCAAEALSQTTAAYTFVAHDAWLTFRPPNATCCGIINETLSWNTVMAVVYQERKYVDAVLEVLPPILSETSTADKEAPSGNHEWVYGRAGYLYLLRVLNKYFREDIPAISATVTESVIRRLLHSLKDERPWAFVDRPYIGAGHGWLGIITQILLSAAACSSALLHECKDILGPMMHQLLEAQLPDGNWPDFIPDAGEKIKDDRVQLGHGAPGVVISLLALRSKVYTANQQDESDDDARIRSAIDQAIERAQVVIWRRGLLTKEPCLQHGCTGNAFALTDKRRAQTFMAMSTIEEVESGLREGYEVVRGENKVKLDASSSSGLHRGVAGRAWAFWMLETGRWGEGELITYTDV